MPIRDGSPSLSPYLLFPLCLSFPLPLHICTCLSTSQTPELALFQVESPLKELNVPTGSLGPCPTSSATLSEGVGGNPSDY
jgi:hypothetical protein